MLGKRWTGLVLAALMNGPGHFAQLRRAVPGISERMLSDRLTELAALGLVVRTVEEGPPAARQLPAHRRPAWRCGPPWPS